MNQVSLEISSICVSCDSCRLICPEAAVVSDGKLYSIDQWSCTLCGLCVEVCPVECIKEKIST